MKKVKTEAENVVKSTEKTLDEIKVVDSSAAEEQVKPVKKSVTKVGSLLKEMRLQKGLRLPDVSKRLCIRKFYLEAIEDSNYKEIPAFPYGVGFIRSYAEYLGLNGSNIVELYKEETNINPDKDIYMLEPQSEANVPGRKYLIISLLAVILVYVAWYMYNSSKSEDVATEATIEEVSSPEEQSETATMPLVVEDYAVTPEVLDVAPSDATQINDPASNTESTSQVVITEDSFEEKSAPQVKDTPAEPTPQGVVVKVKEETWVEVKDANKLYISKVLQPGTEYVVPEGGKGMILSIGKYNGADVYINGKLTNVVRPNKKTNISLDGFLSENH